MGLSLSPLLTPYGFTTTPTVEILGMSSEGRAYHDQQLYDLGWGVAYIGAIVLLAPLNPLTRN